MSTISKVKEKLITEKISQGDIFNQVILSDIVDQEVSYIDILEYTFPQAIIVSQACDVEYMSDIVTEKQGKFSKYMPQILMCPIYNVGLINKEEHLKAVFDENEIRIINNERDDGYRVMFGDDKKAADNDLHYRFHLLTLQKDKDKILNDAVIDFKHCFSVSANYLISNLKNRKYGLEPIFAEQITLKFCSYLSRVAIP